MLHPQKPALAQEGECPYESYATWCDDGNPLNGFWYQDSIWTPGLPTVDTWFTPTPIWTIGKATFYYPGLMKATAAYRGLDLEGYLGGVSLMTCADLGFDVWLRRPGHDWEGPYLSVDCARRGDLYGVVVGRGEVVEVSWDTAKRWGMVSPAGKIVSWNIERVQVSKVPPDELGASTSVVLQDWFEEILEYECCSTTLSQPLYRHPRTWRIENVWKTFPVPVPAPLAPAIPSPTPTRVLQESDYGAILTGEPDEPIFIQEVIEMSEIDPKLAAGIVSALSIVVWFLTFVWSGLLKKPKPSENVLKVLVVIGAFVLAYFYSPIALPVYSGDPLGFAVAFLMVVISVVKAAQLFYDFIWSNLMKLLDKAVAKFTGRSADAFALFMPKRS